MPTAIIGQDARGVPKFLFPMFCSIGRATAGMEVSLRRRQFITALTSAAAAWPLAAHAYEPDRIRRIGFLTAGLSETDPESLARIGVFRQALRDLGWVEGRNIRIDYRYADGDAMRAAKVAKELIDAQPDVVFAQGTPAATAVRQCTLSIPIVFVQVPDPIAAGFATNLARPEGNITGFPNFEFSLGGKWLQTIKECAPAVNRIAVVFDPANPSWTAYVRAIEPAAPSVGVQLTPTGVRDAADIENALNAFAVEPNGALVVVPSPSTISHRERIIAMAARRRLPAIYPYRYLAVAGGLVSYGVDLPDIYRRAARYVDRILKGQRPADLPIQPPEKFELVINLRTAKVLGLTISPELLSRANDVIE